MIKQRGKKYNEWQRERRKRLKELEATGKYHVVDRMLYGNCTDCGKYGILDLDHIDGRGGIDPHRMENLDPVCRNCHIKREGSNHMAQKESGKSKKNKKPKWVVDHQCIHCKSIVQTLLCTNCHKISIKE